MLADSDRHYHGRYCCHGPISIQECGVRHLGLPSILNGCSDSNTVTAAGLSFSLGMMHHSSLKQKIGGSDFVAALHVCLLLFTSLLAVTYVHWLWESCFTAAENLANVTS